MSLYGLSTMAFRMSATTKFVGGDDNVLFARFSAYSRRYKAIDLDIFFAKIILVLLNQSTIMLNSV